MTFDLNGIIWGIVQLYGGLVETSLGLIILLAALGAAIHRGVRWPRTHGFKVGAAFFLMGALNMLSLLPGVFLDLSRSFRKGLDKMAFPFLVLELILVALIILMMIRRERKRRARGDSHLRASHNATQ